MAVELSPQAMRVRISDPPDPQIELQQWSEPEFRNEVRALKAQVRVLMVQEAETRNKHNLLLEKSYREFKNIHEQKQVTDNQFLKVAEKLHEVDSSATSCMPGCSR